MAELAELFRIFMDKKELRYERPTEDLFKVSFKTSHSNNLSIFICFDEEDEPCIQLRCANIINFESKRELAYQMCNDLNAKYRWVKFYISDGGDINCETDALVTRDTSTMISYRLMQKIIGFVDYIYPELAKARWA